LIKPNKEQEIPGNGIIKQLFSKLISNKEKMVQKKKNGNSDILKKAQLRKITIYSVEKRKRINQLINISKVELKAWKSKLMKFDQSAKKR
jgi:hypothetical protein